MLGAILRVMADGRDFPSGNEKANSAENRLSLLSLSEQQKNADLLDSSLQTTGVLNRLGTVYADTLRQVPGKLVNTLSDDIEKNIAGTSLKVGIAGGIGIVSAIALARSPVAAKTILSGVGLASTVVAADSALTFSRDALSAETALARKSLAEHGSSSLARFGADLIETAPAMVAGAKIGLRVSPKLESLNLLANTIQSKLEFPLRKVVPEKLHFVGTDVKAVPAVNSEQGLNLFHAADDLTRSTPWRGIEDARILKVEGANMKASSRLPGTQQETFIGGRKDYAFHTHESEILPTSGDFLSVRKAGIVSLPKEGMLVFHEGRAMQAEEILRLRKSGNAGAALALQAELESNTMATLVLDPKRELAVGVNLRWSGAENKLVAINAKPVNYNDAVNNLSRFTGRLNIETMESPTPLLTKPGMYNLLERIRGY